MYLRAVHAEPDTATLRQLIHDNPFALFITALPSANFPTIQCTHIPWVLQEDSETDFGYLRGHLARANPHAKALMEAVDASAAANGRLTDEVSVIFNGPVNSYVTPKFYVDTKPKTGKVVPTWNYAAAQVYGKATIFADSHSSETHDWLHRQVTALTKHSEHEVMRQMGGDTSKTWDVNDAPEKYLEIMRKGIIGVEIKIERLEGKFKMSQETAEGDRDGVIKGFEALGTDQGQAMAHTVDERARLKKAQAGSA